MIAISVNCPSLSDLPADCIGTIADQLALVSTPQQPYFRSLLRWSQTNKAMQVHLADWIKLHAKPADHVVEAFKDAFQSEDQILRTLRTGEAFAQHLTADHLCEVAFPYGDELISEFDLSLTLIALAHLQGKINPRAAETFFQVLDNLLLGNESENFRVSEARADRLKSIISSIYVLCDLVFPESDAFSNECINTYLMLPQYLKSAALLSATRRISGRANESFKKLFIESIDQFLPTCWNESFMLGRLGAMTLEACELFFREFGADSPKFLIAYSNLLGDFVARLPVERRNFRTLCEEVLLGDSGQRHNESDHISMREILHDIFMLLRSGSHSESYRQVLIADFVARGLLTKEEFEALIDHHIQGGQDLHNFFDLARLLDSMEKTECKAREIAD